MKVLARSALLLAIALSGTATAVTLPGKTLKGAQNGKGPKLNPKVAFGEPATPCEHLDKTYSELLLYARANWPALYRLAIEQRLNGSSKEDVRLFLLDLVCAAEGTPLNP